MRVDCCNLIILGEGRTSLPADGQTFRRIRTMQILVPRCCGTALLYIIHSKTPSISSSSSFVAYFRSTPTCFEKWKYKWNNSLELGRPQPSKTYVKYKRRQKRADAKKALNDIFFRSGTSKYTLEGELSKKQGTKSWDGDPTDNKKKRDPLKSSPRKNRNKSKSKKGYTFKEFDDDDDDPRTHFEAAFGNRWYSWSFRSWEESFSQSQSQSQTNGFEWREDSNSKRNKWRTISDDESSDDEESSYFVGSHSDRITLGLPINGPLNLDQVKNAFRLSALKWHPDKHQGPSQELAEEKFKVCVSAYKSLCSTLSRV